MKVIDLSGLDFGQIQTFLSVASTCNFSQAAEQLHLTQPVVSKRIAALESRLGLQLFIRWRRTVKLTPAGKVLYEEWKNLTDQIVQSINLANIRQNGYSADLKIAYCANLFPYQIGLLFQQKHPEVDLSYTRIQYAEISHKLLSGEVDIAFYGDFKDKLFCQRPLQCVPIKKNPLSVGMLSSNPLARREELRVSDLKTQEFIMLSPAAAPTWLNYMVGICKKSGFSPNISRYVDSGSSLVLNLKNDNSVFFTDRSCAFTGSKIVNLSIRDLIDAEIGTLIIWNQERENDLIREFISESKKYPFSEQDT